ncbi:MAG TPA: SH3 domain-containing protein [Thermomicrobiales bacterium]|nr:SH3 domain-containing protein [Thermomicrobiales bacterium]
MDTTPDSGTPPTTWTHRVTEAVNLRTGAGTSYEIIRTIQEGEPLRIVSGPTTADDYAWYEVEVEGAGTGYMVDAFAPITSDQTPPSTTTPWTHVVDEGPLNLRAGAGTSSPIVGSLDNGVQLRVLAGPTSADDYSWYQVETETSLTGWCVDGFSPIA